VKVAGNAGWQVKGWRILYGGRWLYDGEGDVDGGALA
jgi:hypothetical protein